MCTPCIDVHLTHVSLLYYTYKRCNDLPNNLVLKILHRDNGDNDSHQHHLWLEVYLRD